MIGTHATPLVARWIANDKRIGDSPYPLVRKGEQEGFRGNTKTSKETIEAHSQPLDFKKLEQTGYEVGGNEKTMEWRWFWTLGKDREGKPIQVQTGDKVTFRNKDFDIKNLQERSTHTEFQGVYTE